MSFDFSSGEDLVPHKLDELHLLIKSRCSYLTQILYITESWLTALTKKQGGGILVYISDRGSA